MYTCQFRLNGEPMSHFSIAGLSFPAFSGLEPYVNKPEYRCMAQVGPIPPGEYYICERPSGGRLAWIRDRIGQRHEWFALLAKDGRVDDKMWCERVQRGEFRLHPAVGRGISKGCITLQNTTDFRRVRLLLLRNDATPIEGTPISAFGRVRVS